MNRLVQRATHIQGVLAMAIYLFLLIKIWANPWAMLALNTTVFYALNLYHAFCKKKMQFLRYGCNHEIF